MTRSPQELLPAVVVAAEAAGRRIATEFSRPGGPRGAGGKAPVDTEVEAELRGALTALLPEAGWVGEETGRATGGGRLCWLVDPHDGTRDFLNGHRGTAVSVGLLRDGVPVLGVVHAPTPPDRGADTIAWAEGLDGPRRNGAPVAPRASDPGLAAGEVVFLSRAAARWPLGNGRLVAPARFVALPSIAYRLARAACGDGVAGLSLNGPVGWDYCGGHALLLGAGGVLLDRRGAPVRYAADGDSAAGDVVGGTPKAAAMLAARDWSGVREGPLPPRLTLGWPRPQADVALDRAVGCLLGQVIGDALGALVEFQDAARIARRYPQGVRDLADGGTWDTFAGQPTDDSELALALARRLGASAAFDPEALASDYGDWIAGRPFDIGGTTRRGLGAAAVAPPGRKAAAAMEVANRESQANGALMRVSPAGIWARSAAEAAEVARMDARLSHPHPVCQAASAGFAAAIWTGIAGGTPAEMLGAARAQADEAAVRDALDAAAVGRGVEDFLSSQGWVLVAFRNAFFHLLHTPDAEAALIATAGAGGDTDTNGAICGALLGAAAGRAAFPARWVMPVLACRPLRALGARQPRPAPYWPDDLPDLAEALLMRRLAGDAA
jgi:ADP-ribosylglycohydrolase/fructose-1,6-bisphosphatase/inositol monophosphatase family enzyme